MTAQDDAELLALTAGGDRNAFEAFHRRQRGRDRRREDVPFVVPGPRSVTSVAGWLLGAASGWLLARTVLRLAPRRAVIGLAAVAGVLALSTGATVVFTAQDLLDLPMRNGQPTAIWTAYYPLLMPFGF